MADIYPASFMYPPTVVPQRRGTLARNNPYAPNSAQQPVYVAGATADPNQAKRYPTAEDFIAYQQQKAQAQQQAQAQAAAQAPRPALAPQPAPMPMVPGTQGPIAMAKPLAQPMLSPMAPVQAQTPWQQTDEQKQGGIYDAALAGGSALLQSKNLMQGLGAGAQAAGKAIDDKVASDRDLDTPKVTPLANGAFSQVQVPGKAPTIVPNKDVQKYLDDHDYMKSYMQMQRDLLKGGIAQDAAKAKVDAKNGAAANDALFETNQNIDSFTQGLDMAKSMGKAANGTAGGFFNQAKALPGVRTLDGIFGGDTAAKNKFLTGLQVKETLLNEAHSKGAASNVDVQLFRSPQPDPGADYDTVWVPWIQKRLNVLNQIAAHQKSNVDKWAGSANAAAPTQGVPQVAPGNASGPFSQYYPK